MYLRRTGAPVLLFLLLSKLSAPASGATISGTVKTTAGKPVLAALTIHDLSTARIAGQTPYDHQFASKADGTFFLSNVPAGKYEFCIEAPQVQAIDPCIWSPAGGPALSVTAGQAVAKYAITVDTGYMLQLRVNDPQALLPVSKSGAAGGGALSLKVVTSANRVHNFRLLSTDGQGHNHYLIIPWNQTMTVVTESSTLPLKNAANTPLANNSQRIPVRVPVGGKLAPITINIGK